MPVTIYSFVMALMWFTVAVLMVNFTLHKASRYGLRIAAAILLLSVLRVFLPLDLTNSFIIRSVRIYPLLRNVMRTQLMGQVSVEQCLAVCWIAGSCICFALLIQKLLLQKKFCKVLCLQETDQKLINLLLEVSSEMGYSRPIRLTVSPTASTAYQIGFVHPHIILPYNVGLYTETDIRNMLRHELCHFLGGDLWIKISLEMIICILWWNPAVHILSRNVEQILEIRCDRRVCVNMTKMEQISYLDTLLRLLSRNEFAISRISMDYSGSSEEMDVIQRFRLILRGQAGSASKIKNGLGYLLCIILFIASYCVILQPWTTPIDEQSEIYREILMVPEKSYILRELDGTLFFYCNNINYGEIPETSLEYEPFNKLYIYERTNLP